MNRRMFLSTLAGRPSLSLYAERSEAEVSEGTTAFIDPRLCIAWEGGDCQLCFIQCPLRGIAIQLDDLKPVINSAACDGCGVCRLACATVNDQAAIRIVNQKGDSLCTCHVDRS